MTYRVGPKGQVVIPKAIRARLGIEPGDEVEVEERDGDVWVRPTAGAEDDLFGSLPAVELDPLVELEAERRWERALEEKRIEHWQRKDTWTRPSSTPGR